jgi:FHS family L-fucose permease-like MFS transporter
MAIPMMGYILALVFPIYVNIYKKDSMDLHRNTETNVTVQVDKGYAPEEGVPSKPTVAKVERVEERPSSKRCDRTKGESKSRIR